MENKNSKALRSGMPRWLIEVTFVLMVISAICSWHDLQLWFNAHSPLLLAVAQNAGMVLMYVAMMRHMSRLSHPLTAGWWTLIVLCAVGFVTVSLGPAYSLYNFYAASLMTLVYLPMGTLLTVWHQGPLRAVGIWMIVRILVLTLIPVVLYVVLNVETSSTFDLLFEAVCLLTEVTYAWLLRRALLYFTCTMR